MKKNRIIPFLLLLSILIMFMSCATLFTKGGFEYREAEKNFKEGDYVSAISNVLIALEINPEFPEALELFPRAFNGGTDSLLAMTTEKTPANAGTAYKAWQKLDAMNKLVAASTRSEVPVTDYSAEVEAAKEYVIKVNYNYAVELLSTRDREKAIKAVDYFNYVSQLDPDYLDVNSKIEAAIEAATVDIAIDTGIPGIAPYAEFYHSILTDELKNEPYVRLHTIGEFNLIGTRKTVEPMTLMEGGIKDGRIDYAISMNSTVNIDFPIISEDWAVTRDYEVSPDGKKHLIKYNVHSTLNYEVYGPGFSKIDTGKIDESAGESIWLFQLMGRFYKDIDLNDGKGKNNLIVAEMYNDDRITDQKISNMLNQVTKKTLRYGVPYEMQASPYDHVKWKEYFINNYDFKSLSKEFNDAWFSDTKVLFTADKKSFWLLFSQDPSENDHLTKVSSMMFQGVFGAARELAKDAVEDEEYYHMVLAKKLAEHIKNTF
ncbi:MAG: hypothetical protein JEZ04_16900 [Spirochaetales bacterium]|nr:hypothetical protein [Spirochaetales bacterium]